MANFLSFKSLSQPGAPRDGAIAVASVSSPRLTYLICDTPGGGSSLLAEGLVASGVAGRPGAYFDAKWASHFGLAEDADYMDKVIEAATTANGVCGFTIRWDELDAFRRTLAAVVAQRSDGTVKSAIRSRFGEMRYLWLRRRDRVAHGVACYRASRSGPGGNGAAAVDSARPPVFDVDAIERMIEHCVELDRQWEEHFREHRLRPLVVAFEDLVASYGETIDGVLTFLGLPAQGARCLPAASHTDKEATAWAARYRAMKASSPAPSEPAAASGISAIATAAAPAAAVRAADEDTGRTHESAVPPTLTYLICTTPRTGSTLLCDALASTGISGRPDEYLAAARSRRETFWMRRFGIADTADYIDGVIREATTPNGILGIKVPWAHAEPFREKLIASLGQSRPHLGNAPLERLLRTKFGAMRYVWLRRRDRIAQGISYYRATQTGLWRSVKGRRDQDSPLDKELEFDFAKIQQAIAMLGDGDWQWEAYFHEHRITPLMITYEEMVENFDATVRGVLQFLGIDHRKVVIAEPDLERQADERSHEWERRYRALAAGAVSPARSSTIGPAGATTPPDARGSDMPNGEAATVDLAPATLADVTMSGEVLDERTPRNQVVVSRTFGDARMAHLCEIIKAKSVVRGGGAKILSPRGTPNNWLIDLRKTFLDPVGLDIVTDLFWERFADKLPFQVGGLEMGAVPLISAIMIKGLQRGTPVNGFVVRKERKHYGLTKTYEGEITDDPIVVVDDLINSASTQEKVRVVVAEAGRSIREIFVVVNYRNKRGREWLSRHNMQITSLFELSDFDLRLGEPKPKAKLANFELAWRVAAPESNYFDVVPKSTPAVDDRHVYFGSDSGELWAADLTSGEVAWRFRARSPTRKRLFSSPAVHDGRVYFGSYNGNVYCVDGASGKEVWRFREADWIGSSPAIAPDLNMLFIGIEHELEGRRGSVVALDLASGAKMWEYAVENYLHGSPAYDAERQLVAIGTNDNDLLLIDPKAKTLRWRYKAKGAVRYAPAFDGTRNTVVCGSSDGRIHVVDIDSGDAVWKVRTDDMIYSTPLIVGDRAYVPSTDKFLYVLDLADRRVVKRIHTGAKNFASPRLIEGRVYAAATSGTIFEIDPATLQITGEVQLPERITNAVAYSQRTGLFYAMTYDTTLYAFRRS